MSTPASTSSPFTEQALPPWRRAVLKVGSSLLAADGGCPRASRSVWRSSSPPIWQPGASW